jgi:putative NADH-flavin reductase
MNIGVIGATGRIGQRIVNEALSRGHQVTAITSHASKIPADSSSKVTWKVASALDPASVGTVLPGLDVLISSFGPPFQGGDPATIPQSAKAIVAALRHHPEVRFIMVGGAGSLELAPGKLLTEVLPDFVKPIANAHHDALNFLRTVADVNWTNFSPAGMIEPGERTGKFRLGKDNVVATPDGQSRISMEDYAIAMLDEVEHPAHIRTRFTIGY